MADRASYKALLWIPRSTFTGTVAVAAVWPAARDWIGTQAEWIWPMMADPVFGGVAASLCLGYLGLLWWTGRPKAEAASRSEMTSLEDALRYLAIGSKWGVAIDRSDPHFAIRVAHALRDALATGRLIAFGRPYHALRGGIKDPPMHALEALEPMVWKDVHIDAWRAINLPQHLNLIEVRPHEGFHDIQLDRSHWNGFGLMRDGASDMPRTGRT